MTGRFSTKLRPDELHGSEGEGEGRARVGKRRVMIAGATGSIGQSALSVLKSRADDEIWALAANSRAEDLYKLCLEYQPSYAVLADPESAKTFAGFQRAASSTERSWRGELLAGSDALVELAGHDDLDVLVAAITGGAGLASTYRAVSCGKTVLLANKEALVMAGSLMMQAARDYEAVLLPVDSEHNAIFQALPADYHRDFQRGRALHPRDYGVESLILTGSGGPFRERERDSLASVTREEAIAHPNWSMGAKISVDSATMANKGLEYIEALQLFAADTDSLELLIHPQSIVHSMVRYHDGSVLAQMGTPDMRIPLAHCLAYPERASGPATALDFTSVASLEFEAPNFARFPLLGMARSIAGKAQSLAIAYNAANEIAVEAFLADKLAFLHIDAVVSEVLQTTDALTPASVDEVLALDTEARSAAQQKLRACFK